VVLFRAAQTNTFMSSKSKCGSPVYDTMAIVVYPEDSYVRKFAFPPYW
jgi:hypothetical protein